MKNKIIKKGFYSIASRLRHIYLFDIFKNLMVSKHRIVSDFSIDFINLFDPNNIRKISRSKIKENIIIFKGFDGSLFKLNLSEHIDYKIYINGYFDLTVVNFIKKYLGISSTVFIDVGANIGSVSIPTANLGVKTISVEPVKHIFSKLLENVSLNPGYIKTIHKALVGSGFKEQTVTLFSPVGNSGATSYKPDWNPSKGPNYSEIVDVLTLDQLVNSLHFNTHDFLMLIKIDVEGMEVEVLSGSREVIRIFRPLFIMEWRIDRYEPADKFLLLKTLRELSNYLIFALNGSKDQVNISEFDENNTYENILLVPKEKFDKYFT